MYCHVNGCPFRAVMLNEGRIYSRFEHNHEVENRKKHKKGGRKSAEKAAIQPNPAKPAEEEANNDDAMEVDEQNEDQQNDEDGNVGQKVEGKFEEKRWKM